MSIVNFGGFGGDLRIVGVTGNVVEVSGSPSTCGTKTAELRRHTTGVHEFVGDIKASTKLGNGNTALTIDYGKLTGRPSTGETVYVYCSGAKPGGSGGSGGSGGGGGKGGSPTPGGVRTAPSSGIPSWLILVGIGLAVYFFTKDK